MLAALPLQWMLGFVEPVEDATQLLRHRFPSKVGGRPAWLNPVQLPSKEELTCKATGRPMDFLLQVDADASIPAAPAEDLIESAHQPPYSRLPLAHPGRSMPPWRTILMLFTGQYSSSSPLR